MSCSQLRSDFIDCVLRSDCVVRAGNTPQDCIHNHAQELPEPCQHLRFAFFECKRGMVSRIPLVVVVEKLTFRHDAKLDMRKRFRGLDPGTKKQQAGQQDKTEVLGQS